MIPCVPRYPGIVDQNVELAPSGGGIGEFAAAFLGRYVCGNELCLGTKLVARCNRLFSLADAAGAIDDEVGAAFGELDGNRPP